MEESEISTQAIGAIGLVGPITTDIIQVGDGETRSGWGGSPYYMSFPLLALGHKVFVKTKMAGKDFDFFKMGLNIQFEVDRQSPTTCFYLHYPDSKNLDQRTLQVKQMAKPYDPLEMVKMVLPAIHFAGLLRSDFPLSFWQHFARDPQTFYSIDLQGPLRVLKDENVVLESFDEFKIYLPEFNVIKGDEHEIRIFTGKDDLKEAIHHLWDWGADEVIVTKGSQGSFLGYDSKIHAIDPISVKAVDTTGCGDTYLAAYLSKRLKALDPLECAEFASQLAAQCAKTTGPLIHFEEC